MAMTPKEMIEVLQHFADGGEVQSRHHDAQKWRDTQTPCWNFEGFDYRKKPKPLELWVNVYDDGQAWPYLNIETAKNNFSGDGRTVHMREVMGD